MSSSESDIVAWLAANEGEMIALLEKLVNEDSGSYFKEGVDRVADHLRTFLESHNIPCETIPVSTHGDALRATLAGGAGSNRPMMMLGHRDTVFPRDEPKRRPFTIKDGRAYGPGVADMKAGLVMSAFVMAAFANLGGAPTPLVALYTGDEEIGSPTSAPIIAAEGEKARAVFNCEPGRMTGNVVTGRKGGIFYHCIITGKAAHSGGNFTDGISAIGELAHKINAWHALTDLDAGITVNVGLVSGGQSVNTVAPEATCEIDTRFLKLEHRDGLVNAIRKIANTSYVDGTSAEITIRGEFKPLEQSPESAAMFDLYQTAAKDSGLTVDGEFSGGCADSGITAAVGAPTMCGLGPVGGHVHSPDEYMEVDTIVPRAQALARTIMRMEV